MCEVNIFNTDSVLWFSKVVRKSDESQQTVSGNITRPSRGQRMPCQEFYSCCTVVNLMVYKSRRSGSQQRTQNQS